MKSVTPQTVGDLVKELQKLDPNMPFLRRQASSFSLMEIETVAAVAVSKNPLFLVTKVQADQMKSKYDKVVTVCYGW